MSEIDNCLTYLLMAKDCALYANLDDNFMSELNHIIDTLAVDIEKGDNE